MPKMDPVSRVAGACERVLVAMSGGVDSSVAAYLLASAGYDCIGATMRLAHPALRGMDPAEPCDNEAEIEDARAVCQQLGIPHVVIDCRDAFEHAVVEPFVTAYERGTTPNPCCLCNRRIKFGAFITHAERLGCAKIATGHYARIHTVPNQENAGSIYQLTCARDRTKDQSYFLYGLGQDVLRRVLFPLGDLIKEDEVRRIAAEQGFVSAAKRDSQGICFVARNDFASFIERRRGHRLAPGPIVDPDGHELGRHAGAIRYTVGQRKGLGVAAAHPLYVLSIDAATNTVVLGEEEGLFAGALVANDWCWSAPADTMERELDRSATTGGLPVAAKIRYHQPDQRARLIREGADSPWTGCLRLDFAEPQRAVAPGQAVVVYRDGVVLGGGTVVAAIAT